MDERLVRLEALALELDLRMQRLEALLERLQGEEADKKQYAKTLSVKNRKP